MSNKIPAWSPNGVVTRETCGVCQEPDVKVEHGQEVWLQDGKVVKEGSHQHCEHCPECGDSFPYVCYDCPGCEGVKPTDDANLRCDQCGTYVTNIYGNVLLSRTEVPWTGCAKPIVFCYVCADLPVLKQVDPVDGPTGKVRTPNQFNARGWRK